MCSLQDEQKLVLQVNQRRKDILYHVQSEERLTNSENSEQFHVVGKWSVFLYEVGYESKEVAMNKL